MTREEAESKLEFLETSEQEKAHGLRRIKRRHFTQPGETTIENCWEETTIALNPDVLEFFGANSEKINAVLRREMEKSTMLEKLLEDSEFVERLREKLAA